MSVRSSPTVGLLAIGLIGCSPSEFVFVPDGTGGTSMTTAAGGAPASSSNVGGSGGAPATTTSSGGGGTGGTVPSCVETGPFSEVSFDSTSSGAQGMVFAGGGYGYQYLEVSCDPAQPDETRRSFVSFPTEGLPANAVVVDARIRFCGISFGGSGSAKLHDVSFALPVDDADYRVPVMDLSIEIPAGFGPAWVDVPASSVDVGAASQYSLRLEDESCPGGITWLRYATSGDHPGESCPAPSPPLLELTYCQR